MLSIARSSLLGTSACLCLALALPAPSAKAAALLPGGCASGTLVGLWKKPAPGAFQPGKAHGQFFDEDGDTPFVLDALILKDHPGAFGSAHHGRIVGVAVAQGGDAGGFTAQARGLWHATGPGKGVFHLVLFVPDASADRGVRVIGKAKGHFFDPTPGPSTPPGGFAGKWVVCPDGLGAAFPGGA